jgi:DNA-binding transcriptional MerR regulator
MRIGDLATLVGTTAQAVRFYEGRGLLPAPRRSASGYRDYGPEDEERLRLLLGLRQLDLPLDTAGQLAAMCAAGRCDHVSEQLRSLIVEQRRRIAERQTTLCELDERLAHLETQLGSGAPPRPLITLGKEKEDGYL